MLSHTPVSGDTAAGDRGGEAVTRDYIPPELRNAIETELHANTDKMDLFTKCKTPATLTEDQ